MGIHQFLGQGSHRKSNIYGKLPKKWLGQFAEGLAKNTEKSLFFGGGGGRGGRGDWYLDSHHDLILVHAGT